MGVSVHIEKLLRDLQQRETSRDRTTEVEDDVEDIYLKEETENGTPRSSEILASVDESEDTLFGDSASVLLQDELTKTIKQLGDSRARVVLLESQLEEKDDQQTEQEFRIRDLESQMVMMQQQAEMDMAEFKQRQKIIEYEIPALEEQLKSLKEALHDLNVSEPLYTELMAVPEHKRTLRDHILILAYEKFQVFRDEQETLRLERDTAREALLRANEELQKQEREMQRTLAAAASQKKEMERELEAAMARSGRLETDLKDAVVQLQILSAKGSLYDEVKEELDRCKKTVEDAERQKVTAETLSKSMTEEKQKLSEVVKEKDHILELLRMDKVYLGKELKIQEDMVRKLELEKERQQEKIRDLKRSKQELYDRFVLGSHEANAAQDERVQHEVARIQDQARQEIEQIRKETAEAASRELRLLREMRDTALTDLEKAQVALQESRGAYEELLLRWNEAQRVANIRDTDARSDIKMKQFELDRLHVVQQDLKSSLSRSKIENEALTQKVKVLTEKYQDLEKEMAKQVRQLQTAVSGGTSVLPNHVPVHQQESFSKEGLWVQKLAAAITALVQRQVYRMENRCLDLQHSLETVEKENAQLAMELKYRNSELKKTVDCEECRQLVGRLHKAEERCQELLANECYLDAALRDAKSEKERTEQLLQKLKEDLRRLLEARGNFDDLQRMAAERGILKQEVTKRLNSLKNLDAEKASTKLR